MGMRFFPSSTLSAMAQQVTMDDAHKTIVNPLDTLVRQTEKGAVLKQDNKEAFELLSALAKTISGAINEPKANITPADDEVPAHKEPEHGNDESSSFNLK